MSAKHFDGKPLGFYQWFSHQDVRSYTVDGDTLRLNTRTGTVSIELGPVTTVEAYNWIVLRKLTLKSPQGSYTIASLKAEDAEKVRAAVLEANRRFRRRAIFDAEKDRLLPVMAAWAELTAPTRYIAHSDFQRILPGLSPFTLPTPNDEDVVSSLPPLHQNALRTLLLIVQDPQPAVEQHNAAFVLRELENGRALFDTIERYPLTDQQRSAVVHEEDNCLVIAGAGTGKTSTILAKVGYLLQHRHVPPEQILLLAFTGKAAGEIRERIETKFSVSLQVRTFHSLGLEVLAQAERRKPALCKEAADPAAKRETIGRLIAELLKDVTFHRTYLSFHTMVRGQYRSAWEFTSEEEYRIYLFEVEPRTLNGYLVRSQEECEIANWLLLHGIKYEYERAYEVNTATAQYRQYKPDFYLPDYRLYIEHWGVDREGNTAPYVDNQTYQERMAWARQLHQENNTRLVETYSWEKQEGVLLPNLEAKLKEEGVVLDNIPADVALETLNELGIIDPFLTLFSAFLSLFKSGSLDLAAIEIKAAAMHNPHRAELFLDLFVKIYTRYEKLLHDRGEIDFDDMVRRAAEHVGQGNYRSPFRHIIVDEFQDIAQGRARLMTALRNQVTGSKLFCVGDDWQAIYRFTGSDLSLMTQFETHFGFTRRTALDRTFRFNDKLAEVSSHFVLKNPVQIRKSLTTQDQATDPAVVVWIQEEEEEPLPAILEEIASHGSASVRLLSRYSFLLPEEADRKRLQFRFPSLQIAFETVHASKGLEADYVIVNNLEAGKYGFPTEMVDDPLLALLLAEPDQFRYGEERRLFYVALTRAKKRAYLVSSAGRESVFVQELLDQDDYEKSIHGNPRSLPVKCLACGYGKLQRRTGPYSVFYGCSKYPLCENTEKACTRSAMAA